MNNFVISVGGYCINLMSEAIKTAALIGKVHVNMGDTSCKVPLATEYIKKMHDRNKPGQKRKTARC